MNFFERQEAARRASRWLVVVFILAVLAVIVAVDLVAYLVLGSRQRQDTGVMPTLLEWVQNDTGTVVLISVLVAGVIIAASLFKTMVLSGGGGVVARQLGGVRVSSDTTDPLQRRLLNVVEEMSIASGVPMPEVYLLEQEGGINAFAAGHSSANAAIGVTRGALETLDRAELQGVIAHEFSHILNGDMRLNIRLMGLLFGLLAIAIVGRTVLRLTSGSRDRKGGVAAVMAIALAVMLIGYVGLFLGRLIQAAVSRRREALADASAVQFTREPGGLVGALVKIGASQSGSAIADPQAEEVAHMLFAPGMNRLLATHPPLLSRLQALEPTFNPKRIEVARQRLLAQQAQAQEQAARAAAESTSAAQRLGDLIGGGALAPMLAGGLVDTVGNPGLAHMALARQIRESLPLMISTAERHPQSAQALLLALALDTDAGLRARQRAYISTHFGQAALAEVDALQPSVDRLQPEQRLPALMGAFPALRQLTRIDRLKLMACLNGLLQKQGQLSLSSYVLRRLAQVHLREGLEPIVRPRRRVLSEVHEDVQVLFSVLARHGHADEREAQRAYEAGASHLLPRERPAYQRLDDWAEPLDKALSSLDGLQPVAKEPLVEALVRTVQHDGRITVGEAELLRAICATLHCPLPPLLPQVAGEAPSQEGAGTDQNGEPRQHP